MIFATTRLIIILLCRIAGLAAFYLFSSRKKIAIKNISRCLFSKKNNDKIIQKKCATIARKCFILQEQTLADFLLLKFYTKQNINKFVTIKNRRNIEDALIKKRGLIISTGHFGSWELAAHVFAQKGFKSLIPYNPIKKYPSVDRWIKKKRETGGNQLVSKNNSLIKIYKHLKNNKIVSILVDQYCIPEQGLQVPFFGLHPWTHTSFIKLSLKTGSPIVPGFMFTNGLFSYSLEFFKPLYPEEFSHHKDPVYEMARAHNQILETTITKSPANWMWQHRRFKNIDFD
jgi:Kdo2-lipid IVA lauroyltransferase/acyltransferase